MLSCPAVFRMCWRITAAVLHELPPLISDHVCVWIQRPETGHCWLSNQSGPRNSRKFSRHSERATIRHRAFLLKVLEFLWHFFLMYTMMESTYDAEHSTLGFGIDGVSFWEESDSAPEDWRIILVQRGRRGRVWSLDQCVECVCTWGHLRP